MTFRLHRKRPTIVQKNLIDRGAQFSRSFSSILFQFTISCFLLLTGTFSYGQSSKADDWSHRSQRTAVRASAGTGSNNIHAFHRGSLQWRTPDNSLFGSRPSTHRELNRDSSGPSDAEAQRLRAHAIRQSIQQQLTAQSTVPAHQASHAVESTGQNQTAHLNKPSPLPASPWDDEQPPRRIIDDAFQDPFGDQMTAEPVAREAGPHRESIQVKFKLDEQPVTAGFQQLEDLLLEDDKDKRPPERTPGPNDSFSPGVPVPAEESQPQVEPAQDPTRDGLPPSMQQAPDVDEISPFESELRPPNLGSPLDLTRPESPDDNLRMPDAEPDEDPLRGPNDDLLTPPPIPDDGFQPRKSPRDGQLPELRFPENPNQTDDASPNRNNGSEFWDPKGGEDEESGDDEVPCDRKYNGRDCCHEDGECATVLQRAGQRLVADISLDLTPPFNVDESGIPNDEGREDKLASVPLRTWTSREGQVLAEGRLDNYRNGNVVVVNDGGNEQAIPFAQLSRDDLCFVTAYWNLPAECPLPGHNFAFRDFTMITYAWTASALCHKPLYFENVSLERYGHSAGPVRQPILSAAHFFGSVILLPYTSKLYPPTECQYALGYYEPGDCAPWLIHAFPLSKRAALGELSFALGLWGFIN